MKELGKISSIKFGRGGYQGAMMGVDIAFSFSGSGICEYRGTWSQSIEVRDHTFWTEEDRDKNFAETMRYIDNILIKAKKKDINDLVGVPVEVTIESNTLKSWRVLEEVL